MTRMRPLFPAAVSWWQRKKTTLQSPVYVASERTAPHVARQQELKAASRSGAGRTAVNEAGLLPSDSGGQGMNRGLGGCGCRELTIRRVCGRAVITMSFQTSTWSPSLSLKQPSPLAAHLEGGGSCLGAIEAT